MASRFQYRFLIIKKNFFVFEHVLRMRDDSCIYNNNNNNNNNIIINSIFTTHSHSKSGLLPLQLAQVLIAKLLFGRVDLAGRQFNH